MLTELTLPRFAGILGAGLAVTGLSNYSETLNVPVNSIGNVINISRLYLFSTFQDSSAAFAPYEIGSILSFGFNSFRINNLDNYNSNVLLVNNTFNQNGGIALSVQLPETKILSVTLNINGPDVQRLTGVLPAIGDIAFNQVIMSYFE